MIPSSVDIDAFSWHDSLSSYLTTTQSLNLGYIKWTPYVAFFGIFLDILFDKYFRGEVGEETAPKNVESVHFSQFNLCIALL